MEGRHCEFDRKKEVFGAGAVTGKKKLAASDGHGPTTI